MNIPFMNFMEMNLMKNISTKQIEKLYIVKNFRKMSTKHTTHTSMKKFEKKDLIKNFYLLSHSYLDHDIIYDVQAYCYMSTDSTFLSISLVNMYVDGITFGSEYINSIVENAIEKTFDKRKHFEKDDRINIFINMKFCIFNNCVFDMKLKFKNAKIKAINFQFSEMHNCTLKNYYGKYLFDISNYMSLWYDCTFENVSIMHLFFNSPQCTTILYGKTIFNKCKNIHANMGSIGNENFDDILKPTYPLILNEEFGAIKPTSFIFINCPKRVYNSLCPKKGEFDVYKIVSLKMRDPYIFKDREYQLILKMHVPATAKRSSAFTKKCRVSEAIPTKIIPIDNEERELFEKFLQGFPDYKGDCFKKGFLQSEYAIKHKFMLHSFLREKDSIEYKIGELIKVEDFDERPYIECSKGIHCFMSLKDARNWWDIIRYNNY